jgi:formyl-CoA transferase/succinyl-CoA--D-citramalate CoA-transferase
VLELGSLIAGPFAGQLLADYGATVIKVEPPGDGDPMRRWGATVDGESLWWPSIARNKRSVVINLRQPAGRELVRRMAAAVDVVLENFRPGTLDKWGLGYADLSAANSGIIMVHVSGFGQTGPRATDAGFGSIGEAMGGIRYTTGTPDRPPARTGISLGDSLAALFAVIGTLAALHTRNSSGKGQEVDVAIYEAVAALMESTMADYALLGQTRMRSGAVLPGVAPSNVYPTANGGDVIIAANSDSVFRRLCEVMGSPELADDERFREHAGRGVNAAELDAQIVRWTESHATDDLLAILSKAGVPAGLIYTAADMIADPHYAAREMILNLRNSAGQVVPAPGVVPKFSSTPGLVTSAGPPLGSHSRSVLEQLADVDEAEWDELCAAGVVADAR